MVPVLLTTADNPNVSAGTVEWELNLDGVITAVGGIVPVLLLVLLVLVVPAVFVFKATAVVTAAVIPFPEHKIVAGIWRVPVGTQIGAGPRYGAGMVSELGVDKRVPVLSQLAVRQ